MKTVDDYWPQRLSWPALYQRDRSSEKRAWTGACLL